jgi:hypothetical protein
MRNLMVLCALAFAGGCHSGHDVGGIDPIIGATCVTDRDCDDRCYQGGDFPGSFCSQSCIDDRDCPLDSACVATMGGVCMFTCPDFDCHRLGAGWECHDKDRAGGGKTNVCSG